MAVFLPCESPQWPKDKEYFRILSKIRSAEELDGFIESNAGTSMESEIINTSQRIGCLRGLSVFLTKIATAEEKDVFFNRTLAFICRSASCLDVLLPEQGIPFLRQQEDASVILGRKLILSLIANAFLCTFPREHPLGKKARPFSFELFFKTFISGDKNRVTTQSAKLRCFLNYFHRMSYREEDGVPGTITCTRQAILKDEIPLLSDWTTSAYPLCNVTVDKDKKIEDAGSRTLQVDFAASHIGGGTLTGGRVQEEIRFCICPELLVSMLINDAMEDNEAIIMTGYERFSYYDGYAATLKYTGNYEDLSERDVYGNLNTALTAINAISYGSNNEEEQYREENIVRDLNKAFIGFLCRDERGDVSLQNIPIRQKEYGLDEMGESGLYETSSVLSDDEDEEEEDGDFDAFCVSMSSDIISSVLTSDKQSEVVPNKDGPLKSLANSIVKSVLEDVLHTTTDKEASSVDVIASGTADSILFGVKEILGSASTKGVSTTTTGISAQTQGHSTTLSEGSSSNRTGLSAQPNLVVDSTVDSVAISKGSSKPDTQSPLSVPVLQVNTEDMETGDTPPPPEEPKDYADKLAANILGSVIPPSPVKKTVVALSSAGGGSVSKKPPPPTTQRVGGKGHKTKSHARQQSGGAARRSFPHSGVNMTDSIDIADPRSLNPPSSRMSIAWSTTSTRGEDSLPSSPTEMDSLAINMVGSVSDLSTVMADLIIRDVIQMCAFPQDVADHLSISRCHQEDIVSSSKGMTKIDTFLQSLHEADSRTSIDVVSLSTGLVPFSSPYHEIRKTILRPVATGNWGCGAFKGDPQLKSMLQWMAVSACGRPEMKYFPFNEKRVEKLSEVTKKLSDSSSTVGHLCQLISQYSKMRAKKRHKGQDLFTFLLNN